MNTANASKNPNLHYLNGIRPHERVLYNLPDIIAAREKGLPVYLCESEKDADKLTALGLVATTSSRGASIRMKWRAAYTQTLSGLDVAILTDNEAAGRSHADGVATLLNGKATSVKVVEFLELPDKGGVSDYLDGHSKEDLLNLVDATGVFVPPQDIKGDFGLHEVGLGKRFAHYQGDRAKFCEKLDAWICFTGKVWKKDNIRAEQLAKDITRILARESQFHTGERAEGIFKKFLHSCHNFKGMKGVLNCARSEIGMQVAIEELDKDSVGLFNANNGTIDLKTGRLRPHRKEDLLTKISPVDYDPNAAAPRWEQFLTEVFGDDPKLVEWVQCFLGYVITGEATSRIFAILYGAGRNGKSTFVETISRILGGDYAKGLPTQVLYVKKFDASTTPELARLKGARLAYASEGAEGRRLSTDMVKNLTGGEHITVRPLYAENFDFKPQFTALLSTNHKPEIIDTTDGIWDRLKLVNFARRFSNDEIDPNLQKTLSEEGPGILAWMVRGSVKYYGHDMKLPECRAIKEAGSEYRSDSDLVQLFIEELCELGDLYRIGVGKLHERFISWAHDEQKGLNLSAFRARMVEKGYKIVKGGGHKSYFSGIRDQLTS